MNLTIHQRLEIYRKALEDYKSSTTLSSYKRKTHAGLCLYFHSVHKVENLADLPEIFKGRRITKDRPFYWSPVGPTPERIGCLEAAIKLTELKINNGAI